ncbi:MAG: FHA domain-containing protein, partial [Myxococcota bacterium]
ATATDPDLEHPSLRLPGITSSSSGQDPRRATGGLPSSRSGTNETAGGPQGLAKLLQAALDTSSGETAPHAAIPMPDPLPSGYTSDNLPGINTNIQTGRFDEADEDFSNALVGALNQSVDEGMFTGASTYHPPPQTRSTIPGANGQAAKIPCPSCSFPNPPGMAFCLNCGSSLKGDAKPAADTTICPSCSAPNQVGSHFCGTCGYPLDPPRPDAGLQQHQAAVESSSERMRIPAQWDIKLISINEDGSDGVEIPLNYSKTVIGRSGDTRFPTDAFLSPKHASLTIDHGDLFIEDLYSLNGTFVKIRDEVELSAGDLFLMGRQVLRFEKFEQTITPKARASDGTRYMGSPPPGGQYKLLQVGIGSIIQNVYCIPESGVVLGREKGEIIFPRDKFMSGRHAQIYLREDDRYCLVDLNSSNGTWIKIWEKTQLHDTDFIFLGQQLFRVEHNS